MPLYIQDAKYAEDFLYQGMSLKEVADKVAEVTNFSKTFITTAIFAVLKDYHVVL